MPTAPPPASQSANAPAAPAAALSGMAPNLSRRHHQRLREVYRSSGWPCNDMLEVELLASGLLARRIDTPGHETLRVTDAGLLQLAQAHAGNKAARSAHEALVERVCVEMGRAGRLVWRGLSLRAQVPLLEASAGGLAASEMTREVDPETVRKTGHGIVANLASNLASNLLSSSASNATSDMAWAMACPDVFSIRHTSVEAYLEPIVHEVKVSRADLLGDLKKPNKRAAYLGLGGECWYVLGQTAKGKPIAQPDEIPPECGVMLWEGERFVVARSAPRKPMAHMPFHIWMSLAKATPVARSADREQAIF